MSIKDKLLAIKSCRNHQNNPDHTGCVAKGWTLSIEVNSPGGQKSRPGEA